MKLSRKRLGQELIELIIVVLPMALMVFALFWIGGAFVAAVSTSNAARRPMENRMAYADAIGGASPSGGQPVFNGALELGGPGGPSLSHAMEVNALITATRGWAAPSPMNINGFSSGVTFYGVQLIDGMLFQANTGYGGQEGSPGWSVSQGMELLNPSDWGIDFAMEQSSLNTPVLNTMATVNCSGGAPQINIDWVKGQVDIPCGPEECYDMNAFQPIYSAPKASINYFYNAPFYLKNPSVNVNTYPFNMVHACDDVSDGTIKGVLAGKKADAQNVSHPALYKDDTILNICEYWQDEANEEWCGVEACDEDDDGEDDEECPKTCPVKHSDGECLQGGVEPQRIACRVQLINKFFGATLTQFRNYNACTPFSSGTNTTFSPRTYTY